MADACGNLGNGLSSLPLLTGGVSRSISGENPQGLPGAGGKESSPLGRARKGRPCIALPRGVETTLADVHGPGVIQHVWVTVPDKTDAGFFVLRDLVLRMYWDGEEQPSVEVPLGDFFANGFGARCVVNSLPIVVNPTGGMNCYFPMPFRRSARITVENQHPADIALFFYQVTYMLVPQLAAETAYLHAQWRRENITLAGRDFTILSDVSGAGKYVGTYLAWTSLERFWWGEGEVKFFIDDDEQWPTICGTGTEDYFGGAWCFYEDREGAFTETTYSTPFLGYPYFSESTKVFNSLLGTDYRRIDRVFDVMPKHGLYRWHVLDPILFSRRLRVTIQQIGHTGRELFERTDDVSSVAYWYQGEPHTRFPILPGPRKRWPR